MKVPVSICWLRRDLRLHDNTALNKALAGPYPVICLFIFDREILDKLPSPYDRRVTFIWKALNELNDALIRKGSSLLVLHNTPLQAFHELSQRFDIRSVFVNHDYEPYAIERDQKVEKFISSTGAGFHSFKDQVIFEKDEMLKPDARPYTVYTPYLNAWLRKYYKQKALPVRLVRPENFFQIKPCSVPSPRSIGFEITDSPDPVPFIDESVIKNYEADRNLPSKEGTSRLSVHLRFGTVSVRELVGTASQISETWLKELVWREFFMTLLYHFPMVVNHSFRKKYDNINWRNNEKEFECWCRGETGYPLVDAGMRQLNATGWMHNRVRMVTAGFLVKHLLIDWRWGEAYFAEKLIDYDLAVNNGNWQWVAGSGADAAPYFRIFNPLTQQQKFDPDFDYIKKWIPGFKPGYITPIVDHDFARQRALTELKRVVGG